MTIGHSVREISPARSTRKEPPSTHLEKLVGQLLIEDEPLALARKPIGSIECVLNSLTTAFQDLVGQTGQKPRLEWGVVLDRCFSWKVAQPLDGLENKEIEGLVHQGGSANLCAGSSMCLRKMGRPDCPARLQRPGEMANGIAAGIGRAIRRGKVRRYPQSNKNTQ